MWPWTKVNVWPWPLIFIKLHVIIWLTASTNFDIIDYNSFLKNPLFYLFPIRKHKGPNLTLPLNRSRSTQGHHLNKLGSIRVLDAANQVSRSLTFWFQRRFFKGFAIYGHGDHFGHVTWTIWTNFRSHIPCRLHMKLASTGPVVSKEKNFENVESEWPWTNFDIIDYKINFEVSEEKMSKGCGRRRRPTYPISSPISELKNMF